MLFNCLVNETITRKGKRGWQYTAESDGIVKRMTFLITNATGLPRGDSRCRQSKMPRACPAECHAGRQSKMPRACPVECHAGRQSKMLRACPVECHAGRQSKIPRACPVECHAGRQSKMPRACPVECHAGRYTNPSNQQKWMPRPCAVEDSRSQLNSRDREAPRDKPVASEELGLGFV